MFWKNSFTSFSPIQSILNRDNFTLEELLEEDDLIQECRSLNSKLIAFLEKKEVVDRLLSFLVDPQPDAGVADPFGNHDDFGGSDIDMERSEDMKRKTRFPFAACEVFCCEIDAIFNTLLDNHDLMSKLFGLLTNPSPLSAVTAGYFSRVVATLLVRRPSDTLDYILDQPDVRAGLLRHVANPSISELLVRINGADEHVAPLLAPSQMQRLSETSMLQDLVALLTDTEGDEEHLPPASSAVSSASAQEYDLVSEGRAQAAKILAAIAHSQAIRESPLALQLGQQAMLSGMLDSALRSVERDRAPILLVAVLTVVLALLEPKRGIPGYEDVGGDHLPGDPKVAHNTISAILPRLGDLVSLLQGAGAILSSLPEMHMPYGTLSPPLGPTRLRIVELLSLLGPKGGEEAQRCMIDTGAVAAVMDLFTQFPFNNLLHRRVQTILMESLEHGSAALVTHLLEDCKVLTWLATLPREVEPAPRPGFESRTLRAGYMGHVNDMGNRVLEMVMDREALKAGMDRNETYRAWVNMDLRRESQVAALDAWRCGRPSGAIMGKLGGGEFSSLGSSNPFLHQALDDEEENEEEEEEDEEEGKKESAPPSAFPPSTAPMKIAGGRYEIIEDDEDESASLPAIEDLRIGSPDRPRGSQGRKRYGANPSGLESPPALDDFALEAGEGAALPLSNAALAGSAAGEGGDAATTTTTNAFDVNWASFDSAFGGSSSGAGVAAGMGLPALEVGGLGFAGGEGAKKEEEEPVSPEYTGIAYWKSTPQVIIDDE